MAKNILKSLLGIPQEESLTNRFSAGLMSAAKGIQAASAAPYGQQLPVGLAAGIQETFQDRPARLEQKRLQDLLMSPVSNYVSPEQLQILGLQPNTPLGVAVQGADLLGKPARSQMGQVLFPLSQEESQKLLVPEGTKVSTQAKGLAMRAIESENKPWAGESRTMQQMSELSSLSKSLDTLESELNKVPAGEFGLRGRYESAKGTLGFETKAAVAAKVSSAFAEGPARSIVAKSLGKDSGNLSAQEQEMAGAIVPKPSDPAEIRKRKIEFMRELMVNTQEGYLTNYPKIKMRFERMGLQMPGISRGSSIKTGNQESVADLIQSAPVELRAKAKQLIDSGVSPSKVLEALKKDVGGSK